VVTLEEKTLAVRCRELRLEADLARALESHSHMQSQLATFARDRAGLAARLNSLQVGAWLTYPLASAESPCSYP